MESSISRILVVDDFEPWRRAICSMLAEHPNLQVVGEAIDGVEAVQKAQELKPDLILLDISLPGLNGIEAARRVLEIIPDVKVLFVTSNVDRDVAAAALTDGAFGYVLKVDGKNELLRAINAVLRGEKIISKRLKP